MMDSGSGVKPCHFLLNSIFGNNCPTAKPSNTDAAAGDTKAFSQIWTNSLMDALVFIFVRLFAIPRWFLALLVSTKWLAARTIDAVVGVLLRRILQIAFTESNCVRMVTLIQDALFSADQSTTTD
ncbi:unnamed protein product, partial [Anisakis simplex]|uniref:Ion_trans domain-containing protein n=1 Tax=Anisakis simplex TaxID=6269 RepID=A0A0M3JIA4_ANISI